MAGAQLALLGTTGVGETALNQANKLLSPHFFFFMNFFLSREIFADADAARVMRLELSYYDKLGAWTASENC